MGDWVWVQYEKENGELDNNLALVVAILRYDTGRTDVALLWGKEDTAWIKRGAASCRLYGRLLYSRAGEHWRQSRRDRELRSRRNGEQYWCEIFTRSVSYLFRLVQGSSRKHP